MLVLVLANFAALLGVAQSSPLRWGIPAAYLAVAVSGYAYGLLLTMRRPQVYAAIGRGARAVLPPPPEPAPFGRLTPNAPLAPEVRR